MLQNKKCRIIVDAMGSDNAPVNDVLGAIQATEQNKNIELYLVGDSDKIKSVLKQHFLKFDDSKIIHADEVIEMGEKPADAVRSKQNSSIVIAARMIKEKKADAFVSAGNTGAVMTAATLIMGRIEGCGRPTIGTFLPNNNNKGVTTVFDCGASVDSKPMHLVEYAIMGSIYVKEIYNIESPTVGILSVGEEETKGNEVTKATYSLLKKTNINFVGNVEGRDIPLGLVNVVVCDGFVGNIVLKLAEGMAKLLKVKLKNYAEKNLYNKIKLLLMKGTLKEVMSEFDYQTYGGVPLLGVNGITIIGHGSSTPLAIKNMVFKAYEEYEKNIISKLEEALKNYSNLI